MVVDETDRGDRAYDIYSRLLKDSIVFIRVGHPRAKKGTDSGLDRELALVLGEAGQHCPQQLPRRRATAHLGEQRLPSRLRPR